MEDIKKRSSFIPLWLALIKIIPKLAPVGAKLVKVLPKLLKGALGLKTAGVAGSLGLYSYLFSWQMGVALVVFLFIHEYGHLWAMKKCGLKTRGMYLIPGFGAVALAGENFKSARNEAFIAIMGPLFGLFFLIPATALYFITGNPLWIAIASVMAFINLLNLFPINPLNGGRITKALLYSIHSSSGLFFMIFSMAAAIFIATHFKLGLIAYIAILGLFEWIYSYGLRKQLAKFEKTVLRLAGGTLLYFAIQGVITSNTLWVIILCVFLSAVLVGIFIADMIHSREKNIVFFIYPILFIRDALFGIIELLSLKPKNLTPIETYKKMDKKQIIIYSIAYGITTALMMACILYAAIIPGAHHAKEMIM